MFQNYFNVAFRNLRKNRVYALLNTFGLGLSIACSILLFLLLRHHLSYDTWHKNAARTARFATEIHVEQVFPLSGVPNPMSVALREDFAFLEKSAMVKNTENAQITVQQGGGVPAKYKEVAALAFVEPEIFDILDFPLLHGDIAALKEPNTVLLTEKTARKYFGETDPLGKIIRLDTEFDLRVAGILRDMPDNSDYKREIFVSWTTLKNIPGEKESIDSWGGINSDTYCLSLLQPGVGFDRLYAAMPGFSDKHTHPDGKDIFEYKAFPMTDLHYDGDYGFGIEKSYLWALGMIGLFLLITACVNFINMATAQALGRAREVGVRKSLGSTRGQLFWQFMAETGVIVVFSALLGLCLAFVALPYLNNWVEQQLRIDLMGDWKLYGFMALLSVVIVFLAGAYPGLVQSRFQAVQSLKGEVERKKVGGFTLRRALVTVQFAISQILIIGTVVITAQMNYAREKDWGFRPEAIVSVPIPTDELSKMNALYQQISGLSGVKSATLCYRPPASGSNNQTGIRLEGRESGENWIVNTKSADVHYLETFGLQLVAGRNLQPSDTVREYLVNEQVVKKLNLSGPEDLLGKNIIVDGSKGEVVGILRDFHNWSFQNAIAPIAISTRSNNYAMCAVKLEAGHPGAALAAMERIWSGLYPDHYYEHHFMDEQMAEFLETETILLRLIRSFAGIAVFIGCLGLYGLAAFMAARKTKEVGIRKTLGASIGSIFWIFGKEYARLLVIAFAVSAPLAWYVMHQWLQDYVYRINISVGIFLLTLGMTAFIAGITVAVQTARAALANPVRSLRSE